MALLRTSLFKNQTSLEIKIFNPPLKFCIQLGTQGDAQKCPFKGCNALVAMATATACSRPGAPFSYKNVAKKSEMFISLSQAKYYTTNWYFYHA